MTKRYGNFQENKCKKSKLDDDFDDLWGDDIDDDELEECFQKATQADPALSQDPNGSIIPAYNVFKNPNVLFCSTQVEPHHNHIYNKPSTSRKEEKSIQLLEKEIKDAQDKLCVKEGEVAILRSQLQNLKTANQSELQKLQLDFKEKLVSKEKLIKNLESQLDFKELEIVSVKQQLSSFIKHSQVNSTIDVSTKCSKQLDIVTKVQTERVKLAQAYYPIQELRLQDYLQMEGSDCFVINPYSNKSLNETGYFLLRKNAFVKPTIKLKAVSINGKELGINSIKEVVPLNGSIHEFISLNYNISKKLICICEQVLFELLEYLKEIYSTLKSKDIQYEDVINIQEQIYFEKIEKFQKIFVNDKLGIRAGKLLLFLSDILLHNTFIKNYIVSNRQLSISSLDKDFEPFTFLKEKNDGFLNKLYETVEMIGSCRKAYITSGFLYSAICILIRLIELDRDEIMKVVCKIFKEIVFCRPQPFVIHHLTYFLKIASTNRTFIGFLLENSNYVKTKLKKGIIYYYSDSCCFYVLLNLITNSLFQTSGDCLPLNVCLNVSSFIYNTIKCNFPLHHKEETKCDCLYQLYKLEITIISKCLENYRCSNDKAKKNEWESFFFSKIVHELLNLISFNSYELMEKYIFIFARFKDIQRSVYGTKDLDELDGIGLEEISNTEESNFWS